MGTMVLTQATAISMLDPLDAAINTGTGTAVLRLHVGVPGTDDTAAPAGATLQNINLANPAFGAAASSGGAGSRIVSITLQTDTPQAVSATGTVGSFAILNRNGVQVLKGDVATTGAMLNVDSTTINTAGLAITEASSTISIALNQTV